MPEITDLLDLYSMSLLCTTPLFVWQQHNTTQFVGAFSKVPVSKKTSFFNSHPQGFFPALSYFPFPNRFFQLTVKNTNVQVKSAFGKGAILVCMAACGPAFLKQQQVEIELVKATSQEYIAGARGGGRGVNYRFEIKILTDKNIELDSVLVSGKQLPIKPEKALSNKAAKNSVVVFTASEFSGGPADRLNKREEAVEDVNNNAANPSAVQKKSALLYYRVDGTGKSLKVDGFTVLSPIHGQ